MSQKKTKLFLRTSIAAAVLSLSGCSSMPNVAGVDLSAIGSGLSNAGRKTAELSGQAWDSTKRFLHIGEVNDRDLLDDIDFALMDVTPKLDESTEESATDVAAIIDASAQEAMQPSEQALAQGDIELGSEAGRKEIAVSWGDDVESGSAVQPVEVAVAADITHEVQPSDTLWNIAKLTTGDANNWHIIADFNDLAPDASVRPGQKLIIPADLLESKIDTTAQTGEPLVTTQTAQVQAPSQRLLIPNTDAPKVDTASVEAQSTSEFVEIKPDNIAAVEISEIEAVDAADQIDELMVETKVFTIEADESLWEFAKRTTGDATNWKLIAEHNMLSEKEATKVRPGQEFEVPVAMVKDRSEESVSEAVADASGDAAVDSAEEATSALIAESTEEEAQDIKIVEAAYQGSKNDSLAPITPEELNAEASVALQESANGLGQVMVSGTYYPKAVYNAADFSSSLLMRVSPGTKLVVSRAVGPWLEVQTDKGVGYVHSRDIK